MSETKGKKPKAEPARLDQPNRRTIELLFRDLVRDNLRDLTDEYNEAYRAKEELKVRLIDVPEYHEADRRMDEAWNKRREYEETLRKRVRAVRQLYLAKGITPKVLEEIENLVKDYNRG